MRLLFVIGAAYLALRLPHLRCGTAALAHVLLLDSCGDRACGAVGWLVQRYPLVLRGSGGLLGVACRQPLGGIDALALVVPASRLRGAIVRQLPEGSRRSADRAAAPTPYSVRGWLCTVIADADRKYRTSTRISGRV